ncbi:PPM-type phosphatase domain-containing protein [Plasmodiophora brassicae]|uniref:PPM-type phosphatase domain-containing protein n=1 Tax=Plasmodiophora brassicae TaxID=37360 RepID=A0A3P3YFV1_PLABS|nr:unnamed protein product [Plasmodiophora brassicae]
MGCVSSSARRAVDEGGNGAGRSGPPIDGIPVEQDDDAKIETASTQRRRLSVAPLLVGDVDGKRINPSDGKMRRMSLGASLPAESDDRANAALDPLLASSERKWVALSKKGYVPYNRKKANQDSYFVVENLVDGVNVYGVCDGHGEFGHHVSAFVRDHIVEYLSAEEALKTNPLQSIPHAIDRLCAALAEANINVSFSGTTMVFAVAIDQQLFIGNIGDSRCIVLQQGGEGEHSLVALQLSRDQKPDDPDEKKRILAAGGRVEPLPGPPNEDMGPSRVWLAEIDVPGLAMSRSIGDDVSHTVGVISIPEMRVHPVTPVDRYLVLASDGVWEFLPNQHVADVVSRHQGDFEKAASDIVADATKRWQEVEEVIDDITLIILAL